MAIIGRPREIEEWGNAWLIHPISRVLVTAMIPTKITPNWVSITGLVCAALSSGLYYTAMTGNLIFAGPAFLLMLMWHVFDGSDGQLARATNQASEFGRIMDGICDHGAFFFIYMALAFGALEQGISHVLIWPIGIAASIAHGIQAAAFEKRRECYRDTVYNMNPLKGVEVSNTHPTQSMRKLDHLYQAAQNIGMTSLRQIHDFIIMKLNSPEKDERKKWLSSYKHYVIPNVKRWSLLSANHRTIAILIFVIIGQPLGYFIFELTILNAVFLALLIDEKRLLRSLQRSDKGS